MSSDLSSNKGPTPEEQEASKNAQSCVDECHIEQLIHDTKFLRVDSLIELIKALAYASQPLDLEAISAINGPAMGSTSSSSTSGANSMNTTISVGGDLKLDSDAAVFSLEILVKVVLQNRY
jgi:golgi-specific brefeldin A-resistance guanine nucleotide exchange factor 1